MLACQSACAAGAVHAALRCILYTALTHTQAMLARTADALLCCAVPCHAMLSVVCCCNATLLWQVCPHPGLWEVVGVAVWLWSLRCAALLLCCPVLPACVLVLYSAALLWGSDAVPLPLWWSSSCQLGCTFCALCSSTASARAVTQHYTQSVQPTRLTDRLWVGCCWFCVCCWLWQLSV
jgi:hypothetical protein